MKRVFSIIVLVSAILQGWALNPGQMPAESVKIACTGNSVTYGYVLDDPSTESYPAQLAIMLGDGYEVRNFGRNGATLLSKGHNPYTKSEEYRIPDWSSLSMLEIRSMFIR